MYKSKFELDHRKTGYFQKTTGQKIVFSGSVNESDSAYVHGEEITIWDSFDNADDVYVQRYANKLDSLWDEQPSDVWKVRKPSDEFLEKVSKACSIRNKNEANAELKNF